jgi:hypothetical protein
MVSNKHVARNTGEAVTWAVGWGVRHVIMYFCVVVLWTYVLPGIVASRDGVLTAEGVAQHLKDGAKQQWQDYEDRKNYEQRSLKNIDQTVAQDLAKGGTEKLRDLVALRGVYNSELSTLTPPLTVAGLVGNWLLEIWVLSYLALGCLLVVLQKQSPVRIQFPRVVLWSVGLYVAFNWSNWIRNGLLTTPDRGRRVYEVLPILRTENRPS